MLQYDGPPPTKEELRRRALAGYQHELQVPDDVRKDIGWQSRGQQLGDQGLTEQFWQDLTFGAAPGNDPNQVVYDMRQEGLEMEPELEDAYLRGAFKGSVAAQVPHTAASLVGGAAAFKAGDAVVNSVVAAGKQGLQKVTPAGRLLGATNLAKETGSVASYLPMVAGFEAAHTAVGAAAPEGFQEDHPVAGMGAELALFALGKGAMSKTGREFALAQLKQKVGNERGAAVLPDVSKAAQAMRDLAHKGIDKVSDIPLIPS
jgi:hypothetical protein